MCVCSVVCVVCMCVCVWCVPVSGLLLAVQVMLGVGVPWAWQDRVRLCPLFRVLSPGISLKAGRMLTDSWMSCRAEPAALVATQVNTPASTDCNKNRHVTWDSLLTALLHTADMVSVFNLAVIATDNTHMQRHTWE